MRGDVACGVQEVQSVKISLDILSFFIFLPFEAGRKGGMINPSKQKTEMLRKGCGTFSEWREHEKEKIDGIIDGCGDDDRHPVRVGQKARRARRRRKLPQRTRLRQNRRVQAGRTAGRPQPAMRSRLPSGITGRMRDIRQRWISSSRNTTDLRINMQ